MKKLLIAIAFVGAFVASPARAAQSSSIVVADDGTATVAFTEQADSKQVCWHWTHTWQVYNGLGRLKFSPAEDLVWCPKDHRRFIDKLSSNGCWDAGGYWDFDGCTKWHSAPGYSSMRVVDTFKFSTDIHVTTLHQRAVIDATIYPDGRIEGEVTVG